MQKLFADSLWDFLFTLLLFTIFLRLLPRRASRWVGGIVVGLFALVSFVESFLYQRFHMVFDPTMFTLLAETNAQESSEFLSLTFHSPVFWQTLWPYLLIPALIFLLALAIAKLSSVIRSVSTSRTQSTYRAAKSIYAGVKVLLCIVSVLALIITQVVPWWQRRAKMFDYFTMTQSGQVERVSVRPYYTSPLRLAYSLKYWGLMQHEADVFCENTRKAVDSYSLTSSEPERGREGKILFHIETPVLIVRAGVFTY